MSDLCGDDGRMIPLIQFPGAEGAGPETRDEARPVGFTPQPVTEYKPSVFYYRRAIRAAKTKAQAQSVGLGVCLELERLKEWVRAHGMVPPKWTVDPLEAEEKGWQ